MRSHLDENLLQWSDSYKCWSKYRHIGWVFLFTGFVLLGIAIKLRSDTLAFLAKAISTKGKVIRMEEDSSTDSDGDSSYTYHPVVEFANARGKVSQFTSKIGSNPPSFKVGQEIKVLYDPQKLNSAKIATFAEIWSGSLFFGIGGECDRNHNSCL